MEIHQVWPDHPGFFLDLSLFFIFYLYILHFYVYKAELYLLILEVEIGHNDIVEYIEASLYCIHCFWHFICTSSSWASSSRSSTTTTSSSTTWTPSDASSITSTTPKLFSRPSNYHNIVFHGLDYIKFTFQIFDDIILCEVEYAYDRSRGGQVSKEEDKHQRRPSLYIRGRRLKGNVGRAQSLMRLFNQRQVAPSKTTRRGSEGELSNKYISKSETPRRNSSIYNMASSTCVRSLSGNLPQGHHRQHQQHQQQQRLQRLD